MTLTTSYSPICYPWEGGKLLAHSPDYDEMVVTRDDYEENGHCVCEEKFDVWRVGKGLKRFSFCLMNWTLEEQLAECWPEDKLEPFYFYTCASCRLCSKDVTLCVHLQLIGLIKKTKSLSSSIPFIFYLSKKKLHVPFYQFYFKNYNHDLSRTYSTNLYQLVSIISWNSCCPKIYTQQWYPSISKTSAAVDSQNIKQNDYLKLTVKDLAQADTQKLIKGNIQVKKKSSRNKVILLKVINLRRELQVREAGGPEGLRFYSSAGMNESHSRDFSVNNSCCCNTQG